MTGHSPPPDQQNIIASRLSTKRAGPGDGTKLRIGMFIPWLTKGRGGTERVGAMVANGLADLGHHVVVHTMDDAHGAPSWPLREGIQLYHHPESDTPESELQTIMQLTEQRLDVLVGLHLSRQFYRYVYYAHRTGIPVVLSEHTDPRFPRSVGTFNELEREAIFGAADGIHLLLESFRETLPDYLQDRITVIPNSVEPARRLADTRGPRSGPRTLLTVARLVPVKNVDTLIRAFHLARTRVAGWQLEIVGYGALRNELERLTRGLGIERWVKFLGRVEDPYPLYEKAQLFCLPSYNEAFGLTALEAMAHGLPVIAFNDCSGLNVLVRDGLTGRLVSRERQVHALADALVELMESDELRARQGRAARERYNEFSPDRVLSKWEDMLRTVVDRAGGTSTAATTFPRETLLRMRLLDRFAQHLSAYQGAPLFEGEGMRPPLLDMASQPGKTTDLADE